MLLFFGLRRLVVRANSLRVIKLRASLADNFETGYLWLEKVNFWRHLYQVFVPCNKDMRKRRTKIRTIEVSCCLDAASSSLLSLVLLNHVNFFALGTVNLNTTAPQLFTKPRRNTLLVIAQSSWTCSKQAFEILRCQFGQTYYDLFK